MHIWTVQKFYRAPCLPSSKLFCKIVSVVNQIPFFFIYFFWTNVPFYISGVPIWVASFWIFMITLSMFEMQVCRSCLSQWKGKDEVLRNWVQISRAILPNLHLRGHSYCWILCILPCHILFLSRALTLKHNLYTEYTKFSKLRCSYVEEEMHISTHKNLTRILTMPSLYGFLVQSE